jgi:glycosyltransferase involved in cell wall biosynthesis
MAYGLPILSTNVGGLPSLVTESVNGFTFSLEAKPHCYAEKILSISNDEYHKLRQRARDMYEERFNWDVWSKEITDAMRGI